MWARVGALGASTGGQHEEALGQDQQEVGRATPAAGPYIAPCTARLAPHTRPIAWMVTAAWVCLRQACTPMVSVHNMEPGTS